MAQNFLKAVFYRFGYLTILQNIRTDTFIEDVEKNGYLIVLWVFSIILENV